MHCWGFAFRQKESTPVGVAEVVSSDRVSIGGRYKESWDGERLLARFVHYNSNACAS